MDNAFAPAIAKLQEDLQVIERKARGLKEAINTLCSSAGMDPMYVIEDEAASSVSSIRADTFYGKTIGAAAREYLEMRQASGLGPCEPKEVYKALIEGGMQFSTSSETNAQISVSNTLRKSSKVFHRLPNGQYGLLAWYPNVKAEKAATADDQDDGEEESAASTEPTADDVSDDAPDNDQEAGAS